MCKEYSAFKVPARAQKANGSPPPPNPPPPKESKTKGRPRCLGA